MIEWLRETPADDALRGVISSAIASPKSVRAKQSQEAYDAAVARLEYLKEQVRLQQITVNALACACRANALYEVSGGEAV